MQGIASISVQELRGVGPRLAEKLEVDLFAAALRKMDINESKYPAEKLKPVERHREATQRSSRPPLYRFSQKPSSARVTLMSERLWLSRRAV